MIEPAGAVGPIRQHALASQRPQLRGIIPSLERLQVSEYNESIADRTALQAHKSFRTRRTPATALRRRRRAPSPDGTVPLPLRARGIA